MAITLFNSHFIFSLQYLTFNHKHTIKHITYFPGAGKQKHIT